MAVIYAGTNDGFIANSDAVWATCREANGGSSSNSILSAYNTAIRASFTAGRPTGTYFVTRSFFGFDTSGVISNPIGSPIISFRGYGNANADVRVVKSTHDDSIGLTTGDFASIVGWDYDADNSSNVTYYDTVETTTWSTSGYIHITLSEQAEVDMVGLNDFKCCVIEADHDLTNSAPTSATNYNGLYFTNFLGTSRDPYITYTEGESKGLFFGTNF